MPGAPVDGGAPWIELVMKHRAKALQLGRRSLTLADSDSFMAQAGFIDESTHTAA